MTPTRLPLLLTGLLLVLATFVVCGASAHAEDEAPEDTVLILCEAWRVDSPVLIAAIEAITELRPGAAEEVRGKLLEEGSSAKRLVRVLTPVTHGSPISLDDMHRVPMITRAPAPGGATVGGFGGYVEVGARLELMLRVQHDGSVAIELQLAIQDATEQAPPSNVPPNTASTKLEATVTAPLGALRMFLSSARGTDTVLVFVRASSLDAETKPAAAATAAATGEPGEEEIARYRALRRIVDETDRRERYAAMVERQLARVDVELTDEQRRAVIEKTLEHQTRVREAIRDMPRDGDAETRQARMETLQTEFKTSLREVLDEETAAKLTGVLARFGGGARFRSR